MPYASAADLPSFMELEEGLRAMHLFRWLLPRDQRGQPKRLRAERDRLVRIVDDFYEILGSRNWIFHDDLNVDSIEALLGQPAEEAERDLIAYYQEPDVLRWMVSRLNGLDAMRPRLPLIRKALTDYQEGRHYSVVLVLLSVMDGFVNDFEPSVRKGLHARRPEEMDAWDTVVGHHQGLSSAHRSFTQPIKATSAEEVYDLKRHGLVHGNLLNFDNEVVSTKAWNRLLAVADWARAEIKRAKPKEPAPTWRDVGRQLLDNDQKKKANDAFIAHVLTEKDDAFITNEAYRSCEDFLSAWSRKNYGAMAAIFSNTHVKPGDRRAPRRVREEYDGHVLEAFAITALDFTASAVCEIAVTVTVNGSTHTSKLRWIFEDDDGQVTPVGLPGAWRLMTWGPYMLLRND